MRSSVLVAVAVCAASTMAATSAVDGDRFTPPADALRTTSWSFEAPEGYAGALVAGVAFDYGQDNECDLHVWLSGTDSGVPVIYFTEVSSPERTFNGSFTSTLTAQAHTTQAGADVDSRDLVDPTGVWSVDAHTRGSFSGPERFVWAVHHAEAWTREATGYHPPMLLELDCEQEFAVWGTSIGDQVAGFNSDTFDDGTGASVNQLFGRVTVNDGDRWSTAVDDQHASFRLKADLGAMPADSHVDGELRIEGAGHDLVHELDGRDDLALELEPGTLELTLDRVAVGLYDRFLGAAWSHHDVVDLDSGVAELLDR